MTQALERFQKSTKFRKTEVLIIEDSLATILLVKDFLKQLGYMKVHHSLKGADGIILFGELVKAGKDPIVFLDYELGDTDGLAIITQILQLKPDTKVIIETASERNDHSVKKLLSFGAYDYLEKPIHFERLKEILAVLDTESSYQTDNSEDSTNIFSFHSKHLRL